MGLFDKRYCNFCGDKLGMFEKSNTELSDGFICKECQEKLSPWFDEDSINVDVATIQKQLNYREDNKALLADFNSTSQYGIYNILHVDDHAKTFMITAIKLKRTADLEEENPDIFKLSEVKDAKLVIDQEKRESPTPSGAVRFETGYDFKLEITLDHPYLDQIVVPLAEEPLYIDAARDATTHTGYKQYENTANEMIEVLTGKEIKKARVVSDGAGNQVQMVTCPYCGSLSRTDLGGKCEHCGGNLDD